MKLALLTAAHGRTSVFKMFLDHIPDFVTPVIVGSPDDNYKYWREKSKGIYVISENKPLGKKWNTGLSYCKNIEFDYLIITGSDDIFSFDLWEYYKTLDVHYFGLLDFYFYENNKIKYCPGFQRNRFGEPHGAGRAIHRSVLEAANWKLWKDDLNIGLDASMTETIAKFKIDKLFIKLVDNGFVAMDIKTSDNLHSSKEYDGNYLSVVEYEWVMSKINC